MKKRALFIVLFLAALLSVSAAMADRPVGGLVRRDSHPSRHTLRADSRFSLSLDKSSYKVEEEITVSVNIPENYCYYLYLGVFDDTYTDGEPDYLFVREAITDPVVTYDLICTPGQYVFYVDVYKNNTRVYILEAPFTVTQSESVNKMDQIITEVVNDCQKETEFETVLSLHNWILDHCFYDKTYTYYSAESLFINGRGVCNSYSRAFHLLLQAAGIPSRRVVGWANEKTDDNGHAWNAVCIEGIWHLFDCTWDDTDDTGDGYWRYRWCGLPDDLMTEHIVDNYVGGIVTCSSLESNYFVRTGAWQEECGLAAAQMTDQLDEGFHRFVIESDRTFDKGNPEIETYVNNRIAAAGLSATVWTDIHDDPCQGTFTAEMSSLRRWRRKLSPGQPRTMSSSTMAAPRSPAVLSGTARSGKLPSRKASPILKKVSFPCQEFLSSPRLILQLTTGLRLTIILLASHNNRTAGRGDGSAVPDKLSPRYGPLGTHLPYRTNCPLGTVPSVRGEGVPAEPSPWYPLVPLLLRNC